MKQKKQIKQNWGHGCHKCEFDGKKDNHCLKCKWGCQPSRGGQSIISLDALLDGGWQIEQIRQEVEQEPEESLTAMRQSMADFLSIVLRLPSEQRDILCSRFCGESWAAIGRIHGCTPQAVMQACRRACVACPELRLLLVGQDSKPIRQVAG